MPITNAEGRRIAEAETVRIPAALPDEIAGVIRDALKRSPGTSQRCFLERAELNPEARAVAEEAVTTIADLEARIESARGFVDDAHLTLHNLRDDIEKALEAAGKVSGRSADPRKAERCHLRHLQRSRGAAAMIRVTMQERRMRVKVSDLQANEPCTCRVSGSSSSPRAISPATRPPTFRNASKPTGRCCRPRSGRRCRNPRNDRNKESPNE